MGNRGDQTLSETLSVPSRYALKKEAKDLMFLKITIVIEVPDRHVNVRFLRQFFTKHDTCTISSTRTKVFIF